MRIQIRAKVCDGLLIKPVDGVDCPDMMPVEVAHVDRSRRKHFEAAALCVQLLEAKLIAEQMLVQSCGKTALKQIKFEEAGRMNVAILIVQVNLPIATHFERVAMNMRNTDLFWKGKVLLVLLALRAEVNH